MDQLANGQGKRAAGLAIGSTVYLRENQLTSADGTPNPSLILHECAHPTVPGAAPKKGTAGVFGYYKDQETWEAEKLAEEFSRKWYYYYKYYIKPKQNEKPS